MYGFDTAGTLARGDQRPAPRGAAGDPARADRRRHHRRRAAAARDAGRQERHRQEHRPARPALHRQAGARQHARRHLPGRLRRSRSPSARWRSRRPASGCCSRWRATAGCRSATRSPASPARRKVPIVPALVTGIITLGILALNIANQSAFVALTGVAIVMFYLCYLGVTGPMLMRRLRGNVAEARPRALLLARALGHARQRRRGASTARSSRSTSPGRARPCTGPPGTSSGRRTSSSARPSCSARSGTSPSTRSKPIEVIEAHRADPQFDLRTPVGLGEMAP